MGWRCKLEYGAENRNSQANRRCFPPETETPLCPELGPNDWREGAPQNRESARGKYCTYITVVLYNIFGIDGFPSELLSFERNMRSCMFIYCTVLYWAMQRPQRRRSKHLPNSLEFSMIITFSQGCSINKDMPNSSFLFSLRKCVDFIGKYGV